MKHYPFAVLAWVCFALGCGGSGEISGVVKLQGKPLDGGVITFHRENKQYTGSIKTDGAYTVPDVPAGEAKISVFTPAVIPIPGMPVPKITPAPAKYADPEKSGLKYQVQSGRQTHDVDLKD